MSIDNIVKSVPVVEKPEKMAPANPPGGSEGNSVDPANSREEEEPEPELPNTHRHTLYLDKGKARSFQFNGPLEITRAEFERICRWLEFTMLITDGGLKEPRTE